MRARQGAAETVFTFANYGFMSILIALTLYPLLYVVFASFSDPATLMQARGVLLAPLGFSTAAYAAVFAYPMIIIGYQNTLFYVVAGTTINLLMTSLGAYGLSRRNVLLRNPIMFLIVFTLFFSGGLIPTYLLVANTLNMVDTPWAMILPPAINTWNLIVMRTGFQAVPEALEEAARMDGANDFTILFRIVLPLSLPVVAVMVLFYGVYHWNAYFNAMIYLRTRELYPLQLVLREVLIGNSTSMMTTGVSTRDAMPIGETIKYAVIVVATAPILLIYPFLQRYFVKGVLIGALKE
jgi:putative aldouronate transport system permease protein